VPHATVTQKVSHPPLKPKKGFLSTLELDLLKIPILNA
jgi:hypothetical protein